MESNRNNLDFDVLGYKIKLSPDADGSTDTAERIVDLVRSEALNLQEKSPALDKGQVAILVALKLASEKLSLEHDFKENLDKLQLSARDALQYIEEVSPTTI
ncbi:MAG: cell division protein ZapA [Bacteriovoracaceae bacterium]|nr:cell division protein ZapA [Bacteriovoracaceae bacterium]